jgi:hypothetical protein
MTSHLSFIRSPLTNLPSNKRSWITIRSIRTLTMPCTRSSSSHFWKQSKFRFWMQTWAHHRTCLWDVIELSHSINRDEGFQNINQNLWRYPWLVPGSHEVLWHWEGSIRIRWHSCLLGHFLVFRTLIEVPKTDYHVERRNKTTCII